MPISVSFSLDDLPASFVEDLLDEGGTAAQAQVFGGRFAGLGDSLPPAAVWFVYRTQGDDKVRPSHRALEGSVWRSDDPNAPSPPIDYGCRCYIEPVAAPDTAAEHVLPVAEALPQPLGKVYAKALDTHVEHWRAIADAALDQPVAVRLAFIVEALLGVFTTKSEANEYGRMILAALTYAR